MLLRLGANAIATPADEEETHGAQLMQSLGAAAG